MAYKQRGTFDIEKAGHPRDYFRQRDIALDLRGDLLIHPGTVVASRIVRPWTMVEGNPAVEIAEYSHPLQKWVYYSLPHSLEWMGQRRDA